MLRIFLNRLAGFFAYFRLAYRRLRYNLGLSASGLIGIVAVLSMVVCIPVFSYSISSDVLRSELQDKASSFERGLFSLHTYYLDKTSNTVMDMAKVQSITSFIATSAPRLMGLPIERIATEVQSTRLNWFQPGADMKEARNAYFDAGFFSLDGLPENGTLTGGAWPKASLKANEPIQVAMLEDTADAKLVNIGDKFHLINGVEIIVAATWKPDMAKKSFFFDPSPSTYESLLWVPSETMAKRVGPFLERPIFFVSWYVIFNEKSIQFSNAQQYSRGLVRLNSDLRSLVPGIKIDYSPLDELSAYIKRAETLATLSYTVSAPAAVLVLLFISLTASIAVNQSVQEIATMRGRGVSRRQVVMLSLAEAVLLILLSLPISILAGWLEAGLMARTLSFLRFTNGPAVYFSFQGLSWVWLGGVALVIVAARILPAVGLSRNSIVRVKQDRSRASNKPLWERTYLDFLLLLPGAYAYLTLKGIAKAPTFLAKAQAAGTEQYKDPLMFVAPALFSIALCMLTLRLLPLMLRLMGSLVDGLPAAWAYLSLKQIARRPQDHTGALLLIMISLSLAIYSASMAKTLDRWLSDSLYYKTGADLVIHEYMMERKSSGPGPSFGQTQTTLTEMDLNVGNFTTAEDHLKLPNVRGVTRVGKYDGSYSYGAGDLNALLMGIDRLSFSNVSFFRKDFAREPIDYLMNDLGNQPMGVLVPKSLAVEKGLRVGDRLMVSAKILEEHVDNDMVIAGVYDYFPTVFPSEKPVLVMNLDALFSHPDSAMGYDLWMNVDRGTDVEKLSQAIRKMIGSADAVVDIRGNAMNDLQFSMVQPERVGLFGVLNVGFFVTGLMPGIGFVLYSYASLRRRFIQLGILRAIGLSVRQMIGYLALEQMMLMSLAILTGAGVGLLTASMFLPFLQVGTTPIPPFEVLIGWAESGWLSLLFGLVLSATVAGTISYLAHMRVFQAIKLGETE